MRSKRVVHLDREDKFISVPCWAAPHPPRPPIEPTLQPPKPNWQGWDDWLDTWEGQWGSWLRHLHPPAGLSLSKPAPPKKPTSP